jgi:YOP proteins translocation protein K (YscK)
MSAAASTAGRRAVRMVEFNLHPARFAHRSWLAALSGERSDDEAIFGADGRTADRSEPGLSGWLLEELGLQGEMDWEMSELPKRIWLLDGPALERLSLELALCMHREWLVRMIDARHLRALYEKVDQEAVRFAIQEIPEGAFHYESAVVSFERAAPIDLAAQLKDHGARTLLALLRPTWRAVRARAELYFDRAKTLGNAPPLEPAHSGRALDLLCDRLIPGRFPQWAWCF